MKPKILVVSCVGLLAAWSARAEVIDLRTAVIVTPDDASPRELKAAQMLAEEGEKRTHLKWSHAPHRHDDLAKTAIVLGRTDQLPRLALDGVSSDDVRPPAQPESYRLRSAETAHGPRIFVVGHDDAGVLFGVGRLLRLLELRPNSVQLSGPLDMSAAPAYPLRGHQLGYRPKTNSYDAWDVSQWEQYYRDLIVFGTNAIELVPPRTDDDASSPHFPLPQLEMMTRMSQLADDYGLAVWIWYPAMDRDYSDPATVEFALKEWGDVFKELPRIDAICVPGGDPGHTQPRYLMPLLEKQTAVLRQTHPHAQMWVSPQSFSQAWLDEFLEIVRGEPAWLSGVVFGPQVRISLPELRAAVPARYPIRHYPDITHSRQCQYPVHDWDRAMAFTSGREGINPRPRAQAAIFRALQSHTNGFITYSEGCNDDVNKFVWSGLGWDPETPVVELLRDYADYFLGEDLRDDGAQALLALEENWRAPTLRHPSIETTLAQFQDLERAASPTLLGNWRFQMALYRAYYDAYVARRLQAETERENQALERLRKALPAAEPRAIEAVATYLDFDKSFTDAGVELRRRAYELADTLFASIKLQSSVRRHRAIAVGRGASLDTIDYPQSNAPWLRSRLRELKRLPDATARAAALRELIDWTNPGPGGFYDDLGHVGHQPHLVIGEGFERDPASLASNRTGFAGPELVRENHTGGSYAWRTSWLDHAESLVDAPLTLEYQDLDRHARYVLRVVYAGDAPERPIRCDAVPNIEIHPYLTKPKPIAPVEFDIPSAAVETGKLTLQWRRKPGLGDNGRGCQVSEVWLKKKGSK